MLETQTLFLLMEAKPDSEIHYAGPLKSSLQLYFDISYEICRADVEVLGNGEQICFAHDDTEPLKLPFQRDIAFFHNAQQVFDEFSQRFTSLGIDSYFHQELVSGLIEGVQSLTSVNGLREGQKVMAISMKMVLEEIHLFDELDMVNRIEMESMAEYENENYGMVAAAPNSLTMLKTVKLEAGCEEGEEESKTCTVCFEELVDAASAMPCSHVFHEQCIVKWLQSSHFCPVCRFEMPID